mmetsp:Transcript_10979/g.16146  ORF Transcript_10979/g.16146 Transcript_10979/m.16146 type:complete len:453 (+) Transcript_10979:544-1902(+)
MGNVIFRVYSNHCYSYKFISNSTNTLACRLTNTTMGTAAYGNATLIQKSFAPVVYQSNFTAVIHKMTSFKVCNHFIYSDLSCTLSSSNSNSFFGSIVDTVRTILLIMLISGICIYFLILGFFSIISLLIWMLNKQQRHRALKNTYNYRMLSKREAFERLKEDYKENKKKLVVYHLKRYLKYICLNHPNIFMFLKPRTPFDIGIILKLMEQLQLFLTCLCIYFVKTYFLNIWRNYSFWLRMAISMGLTIFLVISFKPYDIILKSLFSLSYTCKDGSAVLLYVGIISFDMCRLIVLVITLIFWATNGFYYLDKPVWLWIVELSSVILAYLIVPLFLDMVVYVITLKWLNPYQKVPALLDASSPSISNDSPSDSKDHSSNQPPSSYHQQPPPSYHHSYQQPSYHHQQQQPVFYQQPSYQHQQQPSYQQQQQQPVFYQQQQQPNYDQPHFTNQPRF